MRIGEAQIGTLVDKLMKSTASGKAKWEATVDGQSYQCRLGDFVIVMRGSRSVIASDVSLNIKRLSGAVVANVSNNPYGISFTGPNVSEATRADLAKLFAMVDDRSDDLEELINLLG
ncbi:MAG TPA: hypothetical protein DEB60_10700 [Brevundimonas sp.]|nr:hypothetical protein [Brevundimonas sp.]